MDTTIKVQISSDQIQAEISPVITRNADEPLLPNKKFNGEIPSEHTTDLVLDIFN